MTRLANSEYLFPILVSATLASAGWQAVAIYGRMPSDVVSLGILSISVVVVLSYLAGRLLQARQQIKGTVFLVGFTILAAASLGWSSNPEAAEQKLVLFVGRVAFPAAAIGILSADIDWSKPCVATLKKLSQVQIVAVSVLLLVVPDSSSFPGRVTTSGVNPIWLGRSLALCVGLLLLVGTLDKLKRFDISTIAIGFGACVYVGARGPIIAVVTLVVWQAFGSGYSARPASSRRIVLQLLLFVVAVFLMATDLLDESRLAGLGAVDRDQNSQARLDLANSGIDQFWENPVAGSGLAGFESPLRGLTYPHNFVIEIGVELGLLGLALVAALLLHAWTSSTSLRGLLLASLLLAMFSGDLAGNEAYWIVAIWAIASRLSIAVRRSQLGLGTTDHTEGRERIVGPLRE